MSTQPLQNDQNLGFPTAQNSQRRLLNEAGLEPESCGQFDLISYRPIFPGIGMTNNQLRADQMLLHASVRDQVAAMKKKFWDALVAAGYTVLNVVHSKKHCDGAQLDGVRDALQRTFQILGRINS